jgi:hypothetical protein
VNSNAPASDAIQLGRLEPMFLLTYPMYALPVKWPVSVIACAGAPSEIRLNTFLQ